jgi:endogenous inhibitor of DNA gyrase (YacG/DUF329 family)
MKKCPICDKPAETKENPHRPFCSARCKLLDLGNWVDENYRVPSQVERPSVEELEGQIPHDGVKP